jgi:hypothetical protein
VVLERVWVCEVDGMRLMGVFGEILEVETKGLAETAKFDFALVFETEFECLLGDLLAG